MSRAVPRCPWDIMGHWCALTALAFRFLLAPFGYALRLIVVRGFDSSNDLLRRAPSGKHCIENG
ncbi:hypothetical protein [Pelagibacterium luteolum]|uniref:hypothetical protein n=1 Tax=Pelagibacterium luteolum TaxID=440168 RepID=UPI00115FC7BC|nr:hypothetical protein [Pelagibacterium luteolum]